MVESASVECGSNDVVFVINSLEGGGAERVMTILLAYSDGRGSPGCMHLVLLDRAPTAYVVPAFVRIHQLDAKGRLFASIMQLYNLIRELRPRVMLSFLTRSNIAAVVVCRILKVRCVISERVDTASHLRTTRFRRAKLMMVQLAYRLAERIVAVSPGVADSLVSNFHLDRNRISVIENPVDVETIRAQGAKLAPFDLPIPFTAAVGRLVVNKNFALLLKAFAKSGIPGSLVILGEGPEHGALTKLAQDLGIADRVHMPGFVRNPFAVVSRAELFVLPSNAEGFPNGLLEAMALGRPVIATNCESGPSEVLAEMPRHAVDGMMPATYGVLTPTDDVEAMAAALEYLQDPALRRRYGELAETRARMFTPDVATEKYWAILG